LNNDSRGHDACFSGGNGPRIARACWLTRVPWVPAELPGLPQLRRPAGQLRRGHLPLLRHPAHRRPARVGAGRSQRAPRRTMNLSERLRSTFGYASSWCLLAHCAAQARLGLTPVPTSPSNTSLSSAHRSRPDSRARAPRPRSNLEPVSTDSLRGSRKRRRRSRWAD